MSFDLLSEPVKRYIRDKGWEQLRPIQNAAISRIIESDANFILASKTASGKTEAAFLPVLSKINFNEPGVKILYISPLIALINDQFIRIEELCKYLDIPVTKWHGEAKQSLKNKLIKTPQGIVLITPESIEAMFVNKPFNVKVLFSSLKYVILDEIHSFIGSDRGIQLKSLLSRLQRINNIPFSIVGLSATIGDYTEAKKLTGCEENTKVLLDRSPKETKAEFHYCQTESDELPIELLKDLYIKTQLNKSLVFPNSRGRAEEVAVKLLKISTKLNGHLNYFSHHSSIDKDVREYVESFAKNSFRQNFCISCTSTLELGIDIGTVDTVVQIDATHSISSLVQRVGRSGRKEGEVSKLLFYATNRWSLLQSLACWLLYNEGFIEPCYPIEKPYDILAHQILSITKENSGIKISDLLNQLRSNFAFNQIPSDDFKKLIQHLIKIGLLEYLQGEVIISLSGELIVNNRDFYSVFKSEVNYRIVHAGNRIGEVPFSPQIRENENILLAARIWKITQVDHQSKKVEVTRANDGKKPVFWGSFSETDPKIREKMLEIIISTELYNDLDQRSQDEVNSIRREFSSFNFRDFNVSRPLLKTTKGLTFFSFTGTRINRTLQFIFNIANINNILNEKSSSFELNIDTEFFRKQWASLPALLPKLNDQIHEQLKNNPNLLESSKWNKYLPIDFQIEMFKAKCLDVPSTINFITNTNFVYAK